MDEHNLLLRFSEWLDSQALFAPPADGDWRTHEDLVTEFLSSLSGEWGDS